MKTAIATYRQTLLDIAVQNDGSAESAIATALRNGISLTDEIAPGQTIALTDTPQNRQMANYYAVNDLKPATGMTDDMDFGGINFMTVEAPDDEPKRFWVR